MFIDNRRLALTAQKLRRTYYEHLKSLGVCPQRPKDSNYDGLQLVNVKHREQPLPPTTVVGLNGKSGAAKDRSAVTDIEPDRAFIGLKRVPITAVAADHDARDVACGKIASFAVKGPTLVNHFERSQNSALPGIVNFDRFTCEPCRDGVE
jgi:hypothetical protein